MSSSTKIFFFIFFLLLLSGFLFYKGVQVEIERFQNTIVIATASPSTQVLGDEVTSTESAHVNTLGVPVTKVVDGDTLEVLIEAKLYKVRMIGVDTPETVHPTKAKGCFGAEASNEMKKLLTGKNVILEKDVSETDKYNRLLRYVYLKTDSDQLLFVNDYLVREGYGQVLTYPPDVAFNEQFLEAQRQAKSMSKGLWGKCGGVIQ